MSKRKQYILAKGFNTTGAPVKGAPVVGSGGAAPTEAGAGSAAFNNYLQAIDVRGFDQLSVEITLPAGGTSATATLQVTNDPFGVTGWTNIAYREVGGGAYATTALTLTPSTVRSIFTDPADSPAWVRLNISANTGPVTVGAEVMGNV